MSRILVIDDDVASCRTLQLHYQSHGHQVDLAHDFETGLSSARRIRPDLVIIDIRMPGRSGLDGLPELKQALPDVPVIMITAFHDMDSTIEAMKRGAEDYIHKPVDIDELDTAVSTALARTKPGTDDITLASLDVAGASTSMMTGSSRTMKEMFKTIGLVAPRAVTVLITGESGTGKELVARAIHEAGANPSGPFVAVNCAAIVETLLESDLFGHEKGAFTGAVSRQRGKFALAVNGTIFLDEIGELSPAIQAKLLRVLQEKEFIPVGSSVVHTTNARVIAASNVNLIDRVKDGRFRDDLFYRLQVVTIDVPPLRERMDDLPDLVATLLARTGREMHRKVARVAADVMDAFRDYAWPGNVRELENVLMKAVALCPGDVITAELLPAAIAGRARPERGAQAPLAEMSLKEMERAHISRVLDATGWQRGRACEILQISRPRLRRLMRQYGLERTHHGESTTS